MPMNLCTLMMLAATDTNGRLHRVEDMSYPEKQSYAWFKKDDLIPTEVRCNFQTKYNIINLNMTTFLNGRSKPHCMHFFF